jgi:hypothetical protein
VLPSSAVTSIVFGGRPSTTSTSKCRPANGPPSSTAMIVGLTARKYHCRSRTRPPGAPQRRRNSRRARTAATSHPANHSNRRSPNEGRSPPTAFAIGRARCRDASRRSPEGLLRTAACEGHDHRGARPRRFTSRPRWAARRGAPARSVPHENPSVTRRSTGISREGAASCTKRDVEAPRKRWTAAAGSSGSAHRRPKHRAYRAFPQPMTGGSGPRVDGKEGVAGPSPAECQAEQAATRCVVRGSALGTIACSALSRVPSGHRSVADGLPRVSDHLDCGAAAGGVELLQKAPVKAERAGTTLTTARASRPRAEAHPPRRPRRRW